MSRLRLTTIVVSTATLLASCSSYQTPTVVTPALPDVPPNFGKPVDPPKVTIGKDVKIFALENRKALLEANRRLVNDSEFYDDVRREFSSK